MKAPMTKTTKVPKVKAVLLYRWQHEDCDVLSDIPPNPKDRFAMEVTKASYVLPADAESYDAMVQAAAKALAKGVALNDNNPEWEENSLRYLFVQQAVRMLKAIGIRRQARATMPGDKGGRES